jgi:recombination protein RecA
MGVEKNIIEKSGAWFSYGGTRIGQGRENVKQFLREHPEMSSEIEGKVRQAAGLAVSSVSVPDSGSGTKEKEAVVSERGGQSSKGLKTDKRAEA